MDEKGELVRSYSNLSIEDKRLEIKREIAEISLITHEMLVDINPNYASVETSSFDDSLRDGTSEDIYLTHLYEDIVNLKELLGDYCDFSTSLYYGDNNL